MKKAPVLLVLLLSLALFGPAFGAENRHGVGIGVTSGILDSDALDDEFDFVGGTIFGKIGFTDNWGLMISLRSMEDDEDFSFGTELSYDQLGVHAAYMWRPEMKVRPHVKFGVALTDLDIDDVPIFGDLSDDGVGVSVGGGLEAGSQKVAFFGDYDATVVDLFEEDTLVGNLTLGIIFKF